MTTPHEDYLLDVLEQSCQLCHEAGNLNGVISCIDTRAEGGRVQLTVDGIAHNTVPVEGCGIYRAGELSRARPKLERLG